MIVLVFLVWLAVVMLLRGVTLDIFWDWFLRDVFPSLPGLTVGTALGISLFVTFLWWRDSEADTDAVARKSAWELVGAGVAKTVVYYAWFWLMALLLHYGFNIGA